MLGIEVSHSWCVRVNMRFKIWQYFLYKYGSPSVWGMMLITEILSWWLFYWWLCNPISFGEFWFEGYFGRFENCYDALLHRSIFLEYLFFDTLSWKCSFSMLRYASWMQQKGISSFCTHSISLHVYILELRALILRDISDKWY